MVTSSIRRLVSSLHQSRQPRPAGRKQRVTLGLLELERRDVPAIPTGLTDVPMLLPAASLPLGYTETHSLTRHMSNSVMVNQAGTGSAGTFTIVVLGSVQWSDTANGSGGADTTTVSASGTGTQQMSYQLIMGGTYSHGLFTITTHNYAETGIYSSSQSVTWTSSYEGGSFTNSWNAARVRNHTLSWSASVGSHGELIYTSYSYTGNETFLASTSAHWLGGGSSNSSFAATSSITTTGSGSSASYTGSNSWHEQHHVTYPNPGGTPYDHTWAYGWNHVASGTTHLPGVDESTYDWQWKAGSPNAIHFTFHGVGTESASLSQTATYWVGASGLVFEVNWFDASYQSSDLGHVVEEEVGIPESGSGTERFHRDERMAVTQQVTGSGWYAGGSANASYRAVETGTYAVANGYLSNDEYSSGYDGKGQPYQLWFNFRKDTSGSGSITATRDYHDAGLGLALVEESFSNVGTLQTRTRAWGTRSGEAFDQTSQTPETWGGSVTVPGDPVPVDIADGMETTFPLMRMAGFADTFFTGQLVLMQVPLPTSPIPRPRGGPQNVYNQIIMRIGEKAKGKVVKMELQKEVMADIATNNKASGSFTLDQGGYVIVANMGYSKQLDKEYKKWVKSLSAVHIVPQSSIQMKPSKLEVSYGVDMAPSPNPAKKRSGNVAVELRLTWRFEVTKPNGQTIIVERPSDVRAGAQFHDANLENRDLNP